MRPSKSASARQSRNYKSVPSAISGAARDDLTSHSQEGARVPTFSCERSRRGLTKSQRARQHPTGRYEETHSIVHSSWQIQYTTTRKGKKDRISVESSLGKSSKKNFTGKHEQAIKKSGNRKGIQNCLKRWEGVEGGRAL